MNLARKLLDVVILSPTAGLITGVLCSGALIVTMGVAGCIPRDPHPERTPSPYTSCATYSEGTGLVCAEVQR